MENKASDSLKNFDKQQSVEYPPPTPPSHIHRRNAAEQAINTWENNFIVGLCGVGNFPNALMVPPPETILNQIELNNSRNIKSKTLRKKGIGG